MGRALRILALVSIFAGCLYVFTLLPWFGKIYEAKVQNTQMAATAPITLKLPAPRAVARRQAQDLDDYCKPGNDDPNCMPPEFESVVGYLQAGKVEEGRDLLLRVLKARPNNVTALNMLGEVYLQHLDDPERASLFFRKAVESNPDRADITNRLKETFFETADLEQGVRVFRGLDKRAPGNAYIKESLGELELEQGDDEAAAFHLQEATRLMPDLPSAHELLAEAQLSGGHPERAVRSLRQAIRINQQWAVNARQNGGNTDAIDTEIARLRSRLAELTP